MNIITFIIGVLSIGLLAGILSFVFGNKTANKKETKPTINTNDYIRVKIDDYTKNPRLSSCIPDSVFS
ncbi:MAG: hypothetical protein WCH76_07550 [Candidatus Riflemargulisbacteria bacterium]